MDSAVKTESGFVQGVPSETFPDVTVFKGIPFAASTAGENRWRPPQAPSTWEGVRIADKFGDVCPQQFTSAQMSEDCLSLNVWTPAKTGKEKLPVYVWIYGGRFLFGAGSFFPYDGAGLAKKEVIVVTFNYRLGVFGFLAHPELSKESGHNASGNYALLDQIMALKWVQKNISGFGGDPNRVTIGGQSGGAASVMLLLNSPLAIGLFHGAIAESGARYPQDPKINHLAASYRLLKEAEASGVDYMTQHSASTIAEMRKISAHVLLVSENDNNRPQVRRSPGPPGPPSFRPVLDGWIVPRTYAECLARGPVNDVPIISGNNSDEDGASPTTNVTPAEYQSKNEVTYGHMADEYFRLYPASNPQEASNATNTAARESSRVSLWLWANAWNSIAKSPAYIYYWTHAPPASGNRGAYHMSEINYALNNLYAAEYYSQTTQRDVEIADKLSNYWANFIKTGNPNGEALTHWSAASSSQKITMQLGDDWGAMNLTAEDRVDFLTRYYVSRDKAY